MIALVNESYIDCVAKKEKIFGSARLNFAAERICLQNALRQMKMRAVLDVKWIARAVFRFFVLGQLSVTISIVLFTLVYMAIFEEDLKSYALHEADTCKVGFIFGSIICGCILFASMLILLYVTHVIDVPYRLRNSQLRS